MTTQIHLQELWKGFLHLLYPVLCVGCGRELPSGNTCFCIRCRLRLETTEHLKSRENEFSDRFWGRLPLHAGAAMFYFQRKSPIQRALHLLKYKNKPDIGIRLGREFGRQLVQSDFFAEIDCILPIPLHKEKERLRGYNQSAMFAQGLSESMTVPMLLHALVRPGFTQTQTKKKRMERFENVRTAFDIYKKDSIAGRHILLVDDVLTTGATLEAAGQTLLDAGAGKISMATIAMAVNRGY